MFLRRKVISKGERTKPLISIVLPVFNQEDHITEIVEKHIESLNKIENPYEIILVPNACSDNSEDICHSLMEKHDPVRVKSTSKGGWGLAVKLGFSEAKGDLICYANTARTSPSDLTLITLYGIANPNAVIKAERKKRGEILRRIGSLIYNLECRTFFDLPYWDINGTPKIFPRKFVKLLELSQDDDLIDLEFNIVCNTESYPMLEVPILLSSNRYGGTSTTNYYSAFKLYIGAYRLWNNKSLAKK